MAIDRNATAVDPADIDEFVKYVRALADDWNDPQRPVAKICNLRDNEADANYPRLGRNAAGEALRRRYEDRRREMSDAAGQFYGVLRGLEKAAAEIAEDYRNNTALNQASVESIDTILAENIKTPAPGGQPPANTGAANRPGPAEPPGERRQPQI